MQNFKDGSYRGYESGEVLIEGMDRDPALKGLTGTWLGLDGQPCPERPTLPRTARGWDLTANLAPSAHQPVRQKPPRGGGPARGGPGPARGGPPTEAPQGRGCGGTRRSVSQGLACSNSSRSPDTIRRPACGGPGARWCRHTHNSSTRVWSWCRTKVGSTRACLQPQQP